MIRLTKGTAIKTLAILTVVSLSQLCVQIGMAQGARLISGRLTTTGGRAIIVNGASMNSGGTIMTGMTLETPDAVGASIDLGPLGVVELEPNSTIELTFADDGTVRVNLLKGCARVNHRGQGTGEIYTANGASEKTNDNRKALGFCYLNGGLNPIQQAAAGGAAAGGGSSNALWWAIGLTIAGTVGGLAWGLRGGNNSP
ncbi:MAG: hypothetical protein QOD75_890 [Blastocatellia bacterium]|jgi:hypothetical protein|nr:hypothetical protein [Blastocatellia bacterium]